MSLLQYSHQRLKGAILRQSPRSGYSKQIDKEDDWDDVEQSKQNGTELVATNIHVNNNPEASQLGSPFTPTNITENDNFLYSESINFKSSFDLENSFRKSNFKSKYSALSPEETKYKSNTRRRALQSLTNASRGPFMLAEDDENDMIDLEMTVNDPNNDVSIEMNHSFRHSSDDKEEFTTIMFAASRDNLHCENEQNLNTNKNSPYMNNSPE
eukprot:CAMPEP_0170094700 /NCGR_PEP_ID=MMETSP0019_2-20121128/27444_1 /TAXON_ID=98059 /ORGANISM="Dinobryon sp., Strain UTEXLB2267" /LENGTH=211 /DNA_ID=CAMNT_0010316145 /DNA_START=336 /DNA_END=968 /DNA_ORIENTATION=-